MKFQDKVGEFKDNLKPGNRAIMNNKKLVKTSTLYYIHDPMCSWCYAFKPVLQQLRQKLNQQRPDEIEFISLLGGLAADTDAPMPAEMRQQLYATWQRIEQKVPGIQFNYDFWDNWQQTHPRRATYPACRAVIAAHHFDRDSDHKYEELMIGAIQTSYYQQALNPSDEHILTHLAGEMGLDKQLFQAQLQAEHCQLELEKQINQCRQMNIRSYPSLILKIKQSFWPVSIDYLCPDPMLETINMLLEFE